MAGSPVAERGTEPSRSPSHHNQPLSARFQRQGEMPENIFAEMMSRFQHQFTCSICLEVFNKPVTTPCGHSFCQTCISSYWDGNSTKMYQCPLCKESFLKRPQMAGSPTQCVFSVSYRLS
uniref:RING-type domain-containing protein n=1 Tax=Neolamprologus brichardi TaxID=32507 RepID=A0A3Q4HR27_NEOBR